MGQSQNYYQLYMNDVLTLAQTIVIKSVDTANALNSYVSNQMQYTVDTTDPTTWKYYLNISGEYHPTDTIMTVTSMDTLETIDFTMANLAIHTATARGYQYGTRNYLELVSRYPTQEMLILGILYPVDMTTAIAADDSTILGYPPGLIEENEYSFVAKLQDFVTGYQYRWYNGAFTNTDELYSAGYLGMMYLMLIPAILSIRNNACGTHEAHSFHVQEYLSSNGDLGNYYDYLNTEQALWLYRNIKYIQRHPGMQSTFNALVQNLLTNRNLPLARYTMLHDTSTILEDLTPTLTFEYQPINTWAEVDARNTITLDQLMTKEQGLARDNTTDQAYYEAKAQSLMQYSLKNTVNTKVFESAVIDYTNSNPVTLAGLLLNEWLRLSSAGIYTAYVSVNNPITNESINLQASDAFCFAMYCFSQTTGSPLTNIPLVLASYVARQPLPSVADLMSIVDPTLVDQSIAQLALSWMPATPTSLISTDAFYAYGSSLYQASVYQRNLYSYQEHHVRRGMVWNLIDRIFCDIFCAVGETNQDYASWLTEQNIHTAGWQETDYQNVFNDLVSAATGADQNTTVSLASVQAAMVGILSTLSSYSVQFITTINPSNIRLSDDGYVRVGDVDITASGYYHLPDEIIDVQGYATSAVQAEYWDVLTDPPMIVEQSAVCEYHIHMPDLIHLDPVEMTIEYEVNPITVRPHPYPPLVPNDEGLVPVVGIEYFLALTLEQQQQFKDVYNNPYYPIEEQNLERIISTYYATGLVWNQPESPITELIVENPSEGLFWIQTSASDIDTLIVQTKANGLVYVPSQAPLSSTIVALRSPSLFYIQDESQLLYSMLCPADGLNYFSNGIPLYYTISNVDASGLNYDMSNSPLSATLPFGPALGLFINPTPTPIGYNFVITEANGLNYSQNPSSLSSAIPRTASVTGLQWTPGEFTINDVVVFPMSFGMSYAPDVSTLASTVMVTYSDGLFYPDVSSSSESS
jgi:hypothetical protein